MMYALLTEKDGSFDLPVRWQGSNIFVPELKEFTNVTFSKVVVKNGHLPHFGIFHFNVVHPPTGKRAKGDAVDTFNGTSVSRESAVENDPDYVAPKEPTDEEKAAALVMLKAGKVAAVKAEAQKRILAVSPEWKQRNFSYLHKQVSDGIVSKASTDADAAEAEAKTVAEAEGATDGQKAAYTAATATAKAAKDAADAQKAKMDTAVAMWGKIDVIRSKSDEIEAAIEAMDKDAVNAYLVSDDSNWS